MGALLCFGTICAPGRTRKRADRSVSSHEGVGEGIGPTLFKVLLHTIDEPRLPRCQSPVVPLFQAQLASHAGMAPGKVAIGQYLKGVG